MLWDVKEGSVERARADFKSDVPFYARDQAEFMNGWSLFGMRNWVSQLKCSNCARGLIANSTVDYLGPKKSTSRWMMRCKANCGNKVGPKAVYDLYEAVILGV